MGKNAKQAVITALKLGLALGLLFWLVNKNVLDLESLQTVFSWPLALSSLALMGVTLALNNTRWWLLLNSQGLHHPWSFVFSLTLIGNFFNFFIPGGVGGDVVKGYYLLRGQPKNNLKAASSILPDRALGFYVLFLLAYVALLLAEETRLLMPEIFQLTTLLFWGFTLAGVLFLLQPGLLTRATKRWTKLNLRLAPIVALFQDWSGARRALAGGLVISILCQGVQVFIVVLTGQALGADIPLHMYFLLVPLASATTVLPISPAGVGVGQAAAYFLFGLYSPEAATVGPLGFTVLQASLLAWGLGGAMLYVRKKRLPVEALS